MPATAELLTRFYGEPQGPRVRAFVALLDGEPVGVGGIAYRDGALEVFSELRPEMKGHKLTIYKVAKRIVEMVKESGLPAYAIANPDEPTAAAFLTRLGFTEQGDLYKWNDVS